MTAETERKSLPPYLPYRTFGTFLEHLRNIGTPSHIDKSVMTQFSGAMQSWLRAALRYMKLVDAHDVPDARLAKLAKAQGEERKPLLAALFKSSYSFLDGKIDLANTTPAKLRAAIVELGATGNTVDKIMAFMIAMAKDAGIPLSTLLTTRAQTPRKPRVKTARRDDGGRDGVDGDGEEDDIDEPNANAMTKMVTLEGGGTLTLSGTFNPFELSKEERDFVFSLTDAMAQFERKKGGGEA